MSKENTKVETVDVSEQELNEILGVPGADAAMTTATADKDKEESSFFESKKVDTTFVDKPREEITAELEEEEKKKAEDNLTDEEKAAKAQAEATAQKEETSFDQVVAEIDEEEKGEEEEKKSNAGRKPVDKAGMTQLTKSLIDEGILLPFDDDKDLSEYTVDEYKELIKLNFEEQKKQLQEQTPKEFFESLPQELQYAAKYVADGGKDLKGLFSYLAAAEQTKSLDPSTEAGQAEIVRQYLSATRWGTPEEIQEEIESYRDIEKLEAKANQFKPKLDKMQEAVLQRKIEEQEIMKQKQMEASKKYQDSIYDTLNAGELSGIKLNKKTQHMLFKGLVDPVYDSVNGVKTNLFGHLLEKHQFVEPNHGLIAEALWLLQDPEGYKKELTKAAKSEVAVETAKKLKTEQANKNGGTTHIEDEEKTKKQNRKTISRNQGGFFGRG